jgi:hypothetical protein
MKVKLKNMPRLKLQDLLRRRRTTLRQFVDTFGVVTYDALVLRCEWLGVTPPTVQEFEALNVTIVNVPSDGVVVVDSLNVIDERYGHKIDIEADLTPPGVEVITSEPVEPEPSQDTHVLKRRPRKNKQQLPS